MLVSELIEKLKLMPQGASLYIRDEDSNIFTCKYEIDIPNAEIVLATEMQGV